MAVNDGDPKLDLPSSGFRCCFGSAFSSSFARTKSCSSLAALCLAQDDKDLSAGCVVAWESHDRCGDLIDFWTARASDVDPTTFSSCVQRVVLWNDVFLLRAVQKSVDEIKAAIPKYFGFDCRVAPNGFALHLEGLNTVDQTLVRAFEAKDRDSKRARTALIDLDSCGVTALDWPQILPIPALPDASAKQLRALVERIDQRYATSLIQKMNLTPSILARRQTTSQTRF
jgi:hypothetical protein